MRFERVVFISLWLPLAGCVTTHSDSSSLGKSMPQTSAATQASDAARIHTELAQRYMQSGDLETALEKVTKALQFDPRYAPAHTVIAVIYERINKLPEAEEHYRKAVALEPNKGAPNNNLGVFLCHTGKIVEADQYFRKAITDPFYQTPDVALTNEGVCQLRNNDVAGAEKSFRDAIARNPANGEALFQLANTLYLNKDAFRARAFLQRFEGLGKPTAASLKLGHDIESLLGNKDGALTYSKRLLSQFPDSEQAQALNATTRQ
ncbi:type IV pilus biogenesis/stability protein PilW [Rhodanobacter sp. AS-Z3]|uniref:type IV pilus biogenesis/stability protein PilW n=1 Tax=Rhodanobacter sp. AS-Z3 TaxID=3031330 RepID=UPI00247A129F|nr:type IV pilus biogenesis/stability protein PilW [Rhodanobacter sp. AS-Z3]WEN13804.1 type IV pilus biogenesis/stability protein PilW [Rhodanobacter sp. AS-Z3]